MGTRRSASLMLACGMAFAASANAATVDLADYLGLVPGHWAIYQDTTTGEVSGQVVSANADGSLSQNWYRQVSGAWVFDSTEIFNITARRITYLGTSDGGTTWLLDRALSMPRMQDVGSATVYKGTLRNQTTGEAVGIVQTLTLVADGLGVSTPAGSFSACIKTRSYNVVGDSSRDSVSISCPGRTEVKTWVTKIQDTADPTVEDLSQSHAAVMINAGDSGAPLP